MNSLLLFERFKNKSHNLNRANIVISEINNSTVKILANTDAIKYQKLLKIK